MADKISNRGPEDPVGEEEENARGQDRQVIGSKGKGKGGRTSRVRRTIMRNRRKNNYTYMFARSPFHFLESPFFSVVSPLYSRTLALSPCARFGVKRGKKAAGFV